jgi:hypothetical protein
MILKENAKPIITLRMLPVGTRFYLLRSMEKFKLVAAGPSQFGGYKYTVQREGMKHTSELHHSCHVKPIVRAES